MALITLPPLAGDGSSFDEDFDPDDLPNTGASTRGWSYYGTFRRCRRLWAFKYGPGKRPEPPSKAGPRAIGTAVHAGLAAHYSRRMGRIIGSVEGGIRAVARVHHMDPKQLDRALNATKAYIDTTAREEYTPVLVEEEVQIRFGPEWDPPGARLNLEEDKEGGPLYTARLDVGLVNRAGRVWIQDHKTAAKPGAQTLDGYGMHGQIHGFHHLGRARWGEAFAGVLIGLIQSIPPHKIRREPPPIAPNLIAAFPRTIRRTAAEIQWWTQACGSDPLNYDPLSNETGCRTIYGWCDYKGPCR